MNVSLPTIVLSALAVSNLFLVGIGAASVPNCEKPRRPYAKVLSLGSAFLSHLLYLAGVAAWQFDWKYFYRVAGFAEIVGLLLAITACIGAFWSSGRVLWTSVVAGAMALWMWSLAAAASSVV